MIRRLVFASVLLLVALPVLAADPSAGGGCRLPNLAGLTPDQIAIAALEADILMDPAPGPAAVPLCPTISHCNSITNCGIDAASCVTVNIGACCQPPGGGPKLCCISGTMFVTTCNCVCTGNPCAIQCPNTNEVTKHC
jgi:hypothetical protein